VSFYREVFMLEGQATWDYQDLIREPSTGFKLYTLFLFIACVVGVIKLLKVWHIARPFQIPQRNIPIAADRLQVTASSLGHWIGLTTLVCGILTSITLFNVCEGLLGEKVIGNAIIVFVVRDFASGLSMALFVVLFLYLIRWYLLIRVAHFRKQTIAL
jgi:hypothetical protein